MSERRLGSPRMMHPGPNSGAMDDPHEETKACFDNGCVPVVGDPPTKPGDAPLPKATPEQITDYQRGFRDGTWAEQGRIERRDMCDKMGVAAQSPASTPAPQLVWNPQVEIYRKALMEKFAGTISMDRIANAAYILAEDYEGDVRVQIHQVERVKDGKWLEIIHAFIELVDEYHVGHGQPSPRCHMCQLGEVARTIVREKSPLSESTPPQPVSEAAPSKSYLDDPETWRGIGDIPTGRETPLSEQKAATSASSGAEDTTPSLRNEPVGVIELKECPICFRSVDMIVDPKAVNIGGVYYHGPCSRFSASTFSEAAQPTSEQFERAKDIVHAEIMNVIGDREAFKNGWLVRLVAENLVSEEAVNEQDI